MEIALSLECTRLSAPVYVGVQSTKKNSLPVANVATKITNKLVTLYRRLAYNAWRVLN
jgi:hypothetical protein